jgi:hypothetical protein
MRQFDREQQPPISQSPTTALHEFARAPTAAMPSQQSPQPIPRIELQSTGSQRQPPQQQTLPPSPQEISRQIDELTAISQAGRRGERYQPPGTNPPARPQQESTPGYTDGEFTDWVRARHLPKTRRSREKFEAELRNNAAIDQLGTISEAAKAGERYNPPQKSSPNSTNVGKTTQPQSPLRAIVQSRFVNKPVPQTWEQIIRTYDTAPVGSPENRRIERQLQALVKSGQLPQMDYDLITLQKRNQWEGSEQQKAYIRGALTNGYRGTTENL